MFAPTPEQQAALDAFTTRQDMVLEAGAGTGKTSTLKLMANADETRRGTYVAYNKSIANEAAAEFPNRVRCVTAHSLGYRAVQAQWGGALQARLRAPRIPPNETSRLLGTEHLNLGEGRKLTSFKVARVAMDAVRLFCYSRDEKPQKWHVPTIPGAETTEARARLVEAVLPAARKAWEDLTRPDGRLFFPHDAYLKMWALSNPTIEGDYLLLDEWQDANPVVAGIMDQQTHLQRVAVGDANQSIYGWRGATDALSKMDAAHRLLLSQSFRFGPAVADEANKWLGLLDARLRLTGTPAIPSTLATIDRPDALLCRTNAEAVTQLMRLTAKGYRVALVGGGEEFKKLAAAAIDLRTKGYTSHPELVAFTSWGMVQDYVEEDSAGGDLAVAVKLIDNHGAETIIKAIEGTHPERSCDVTISTAHKSKGREWGRVRVAEDFHPPKDDEITGEQRMPSREDMMLAYVTVTRAKQVLDRSGLAWVDQYLPGSQRMLLARVG